MERGTDSAQCITAHAGCMRVNGSTIIGMGGASNATAMVTSTKVILGIINHMEKVFTHGSMGKCTKVNGKMD